MRGRREGTTPENSVQRHTCPILLWHGQIRLSGLEAWNISRLASCKFDGGEWDESQDTMM